MLFGRFVDVGWHYRKRTTEEQATGGDGDRKWWKKVVEINEGGPLDTKWLKELCCIVTWCQRRLILCRDVNDKALEKMEAPQSYLEQLPKHAKSLALAESLRKAVTKQVAKLDVFSVLAVRRPTPSRFGDLARRQTPQRCSTRTTRDPNMRPTVTLYGRRPASSVVTSSLSWRR